jgi:hypothetical protein
MNRGRAGWKPRRSVAKPAAPGQTVGQRAYAAAEAESKARRASDPVTPGAKDRAGKTTADFHALGHLAIGRMNKTEERYAKWLDEQKAAGDVLWWKFEPMRLWMGSKMAGYRVDFLVQKADRELQVHEVKGGFIVDKSYRVWRMVAEAYPVYHFFLYQLKSKVGWVFADYDIPSSADVLKVG